MAAASIEVVIVGAVERVGALRLQAGSTLRAALEAAGGLAYRSDARPEGQLLLRRRGAASRQVRVQRWNIFEDELQSWQSTPLEHRDVIVFAWSLPGACAEASLVGHQRQDGVERAVRARPRGCSAPGRSAPRCPRSR